MTNMSKLHVNGQKNLLQKYYSVVWVKSAVTSVSVSVSVYYVAVRTIVLSRNGSNLARPVTIHDIIHSLK